MKKIAIIGSGVGSLVVARQLAKILNETKTVNEKECRDKMRDCQLFLNHGFAACEKCDEYY